MPKIIFRDVSIQHASCFMPIYEKMVKEGFDCELQYVDVPRKDKLYAFLKEHVHDSYDLLITCTTTMGKDEGKSFFLPHGVGGEEEPSAGHIGFRGIFLPGQFWMDLFRKSNIPNIYLIGHPKTDLLFQSKRYKIAEELKAKLNLPYDYTVLYAPTLKRLDSFDDAALHLLQMFNSMETNLVIKTHCDDEDENYQPRKYMEVKRKAEKMKNVYWTGGTFPDITPLYLISDVLVSASSGCLREFMLTDRPSIQLTNVAENLRKRYYYEGCVHSTLNDLRKNILHAISTPKWMRRERREQVKWLFHKPDGHATDRAINKIKECMHW